MIMNLVLGTVVVLTTLSVPANATLGPAAAEKADAVFRDLNVTGGTWIGHTGIYEGLILNLHDWIVDAMDPAEQDLQGVHERPFSEFNIPGRNYWGSATATSTGLTRQQRLRLVDFAMSQDGLADYALGGWPDIMSPATPDARGSFRCDGFVEWAYEQVGVAFFAVSEMQHYDLIFRPNTLWGRMTQTPNTTLVVGPALTVTDSQNNVVADADHAGATGDPNLAVFATDGQHGSGLARLEIWQGSHNSGSLWKTIPTEYDVEHLYSSTELDSAHFPEGPITVCSYDRGDNDTCISFPIADPYFLVENEKLIFFGLAQKTHENWGSRSFTIASGEGDKTPRMAQNG